MKTACAENSSMDQPPVPVRLLIAEDSPEDLKRIVHELSRPGPQYSHTHVKNRAQFEQALGSGSYDAVISDFRFPDWTGMKAFAHARAIDPLMPFLLVTGTLGDEAAVDCIKRGVDGYVLKEHISRLHVALERASYEKSLRREHLATQESLRLSEIRNHLLVEYSIYGICRARADGSFIDTNPAFLRILNLQTSRQPLEGLQEIFRHGFLPRTWTGARSGSGVATPGWRPADRSSKLPVACTAGSGRLRRGHR
jgi:CheY-like chemotaxis protein